VSAVTAREEADASVTRGDLQVCSGDCVARDSPWGVAETGLAVLGPTPYCAQLFGLTIMNSTAFLLHEDRQKVV
jgi:hypothetical protein